MVVSSPVRAVTGLNFFCPAVRENSALTRVVGGEMDESFVGDARGDAGSASTVRGFFFDVTSVQPDIGLRVERKSIDSP